jgi:hypothetical protein
MVKAVSNTPAAQSAQGAKTKAKQAGSAKRARRKK